MATARWCHRACLVPSTSRSRRSTPPRTSMSSRCACPDRVADEVDAIGIAGAEDDPVLGGGQAAAAVRAAAVNL